MEYKKRQAARKVAEADPFRSVYVYRGGSPDPNKVPVDIRYNVYQVYSRVAGDSISRTAENDPMLFSSSLSPKMRVEL